MDKNVTEKYRKLIDTAPVVFVPFTGSDDILDLSVSRKINNKHELARRYPANTYITMEYKTNTSTGYVLVSKHYLRENVPELKKAKTTELTEAAENIINNFITQLGLIENGYQ